MQTIPDNIDLLRAQINVQGVEGSLIITDLDIVEDSLTLDRNSVSGRNIEVGNAETSELAFSLDNEDHRFDSFRFEGAEATVTLFSESGSIPAGVYIIDSPPKRETQMRITALDNMSRFNKLYDTQLAYPATLLQILQDACSKCGVTLYTMSFLHDDYVVSERPEDDNLTYHNIVAMVAELAGSNAWADWNGQLRLTWYGDVQPAEIEISEDDRYGIETAENDIRITGIVIRQGESESLIGSDEYALIVEDNLLLQDDAETVMQALYEKIAGFVYRPFGAQIDARPELWPGDVIGKLWTDDGTLTTSIITSHLFQLNGRSRISAAGETKQIASQVKPAPFTARQKNILQVVAKQEAERQVTTMEQAVLSLNQLMTNSWGFHNTTITDPVTGAKTYYMHDQSTLETSQVIYVMTGSGFAWTDQGWNDGSPDWQYGTTADGNAVLKVLTAYGINADWINVGILTSTNGYSWINLDDGKFNFGNDALAWNGSALTAKGTFETCGSTQSAKMDGGSLRLVNNGTELGYVSIQTADPTGPWITAAADAKTINFAKLVSTSLYTAYQIDWDSTDGTSATHKFYGQMQTPAIAASGVVSCWRVEPHLDDNDRCGTTTKRWQAVHALEGYFNKLTIGTDTCWAAGAMTLTTASWTSVSFGKTFPSPPRVFGQYTHNFYGDIGELKVRDITTTGFEATIGGSGFSDISANWFAILV